MYVVLIILCLVFAPFVIMFLGVLVVIGLDELLYWIAARYRRFTVRDLLVLTVIVAVVVWSFTWLPDYVLDVRE